MAAAFLRGVNDLRIGRTLSAHADVVYNRKVKKVIILRYIGDALCALRQRQRANVHAAQLDRAVLHVPKGGDEAGNRGFAAAGGPHKCVDRARFNVQADAVEHLFIVIGEADVFQLDGVVRWKILRFLRALHILAGQHLRHLADDGLDLYNVVGVGEGSDQRLHDAEGKHDDCQKCFCQQGAVHIEKAAHRQDAEKC